MMVQEKRSSGRMQFDFASQSFIMSQSLALALSSRDSEGWKYCMPAFFFFSLFFQDIWPELRVPSRAGVTQTRLSIHQPLMPLPMTRIL